MLLTVIGFTVIALITLYCIFAAGAILYGSVGLTGRIAGEFWFVAAIAGFFCWLCWYIWPFQISLSVVAS